MKKGHKIYYSDNIDLYIPKSHYGVLCIPFLPQEIDKTKTSKNTLTCKGIKHKKNRYSNGWKRGRVLA